MRCGQRRRQRGGARPSSSDRRGRSAVLRPSAWRCTRPRVGRSDRPCARVIRRVPDCAASASACGAPSAARVNHMSSVRARAILRRAARRGRRRDRPASADSVHAAPSRRPDRHIPVHRDTPRKCGSRRPNPAGHGRWVIKRLQLRALPGAQNPRIYWPPLLSPRLLGNEQHTSTCTDLSEASTTGRPRPMRSPILQMPLTACRRSATQMW